MADVRDVLRRLDPNVVTEFDKRGGVKYHYHWAHRRSGLYKSWQDVIVKSNYL